MNLTKQNTNIIAGLGKQLYGWMLDLLFPKFCVACGKYGDNICFDCFQLVENNKTGTCFYCGRISSGGKVCVQCRKSQKPHYDKIIWSGSYKNEPLKAMIHGLKYNGIIDLAEILAELLVQRIKDSGIELDVIAVPVPLHWEKQKKREFNQAELIARHLSKRLNLHGGMALKRNRETTSQVKLRRDERILNMRDAFSCVDRKLIEGNKVLLIDDVATTGSTINECAKILKAAGARKVIVAVVARG